MRTRLEGSLKCTSAPAGGLLFCALNTAPRFSISSRPRDRTNPKMGSQIHTLQIPPESPSIATHSSYRAPTTTTYYPGGTPFTANQTYKCSIPMSHLFGFPQTSRLIEELQGSYAFSTEQLHRLGNHWARHDVQSCSRTVDNVLSWRFLLV